MIKETMNEKYLGVRSNRSDDRQYLIHLIIRGGVNCRSSAAIGVIYSKGENEKRRRKNAMLTRIAGQRRTRKTVGRSIVNNLNGPR